MKLTEEQIAEIKSYWGDWENVHGKFDDLMEARLKELDPEFVESLHEATKGATFWFA